MASSNPRPQSLFLPRIFVDGPETPADQVRLGLRRSSGVPDLRGLTLVESRLTLGRSRSLVARPLITQASRTMASLYQDPEIPDIEDPELILDGFDLARDQAEAIPGSPIASSDAMGAALRRGSVGTSDNSLSFHSDSSLRHSDSTHERDPFEYAHFMTPCTAAASEVPMPDHQEVEVLAEQSEPAMDSVKVPGDPFEWSEDRSTTNEEQAGPKDEVTAEASQKQEVPRPAGESNTPSQASHDPSEESTSQSRRDEDQDEEFEPVVMKGFVGVRRPFHPRMLLEQMFPTPFNNFDVREECLILVDAYQEYHRRKNDAREARLARERDARNNSNSPSDPLIRGGVASSIPSTPGTGSPIAGHPDLKRDNLELIDELLEMCGVPVKKQSHNQIHRRPVGNTATARDTPSPAKKTKLQPDSASYTPSHQPQPRPRPLPHVPFTPATTLQTGTGSGFLNPPPYTEISRGRSPTPSPRTPTRKLVQHCYSFDCRICSDIKFLRLYELIMSNALSPEERQKIINNNRSLRNIKNELESLAEHGAITDEAYDTILRALPNESSLNGSSQSNRVAPSSAVNTSQQSVPPPAYGAATPTPPLPSRAGPPPPPVTEIARATALYPYNQPGDCNFETGDQISISEYMNADWWFGKNLRTGQAGVFPVAYVQLIQAPPTSGGYYGNEKMNHGYAPSPVPPPQGNPYNSSVPPMAIAEQPTDGKPGKGAEMGKKFGKKLGNAAIFGAGATIGGNIVNSIF